MKPKNISIKKVAQRDDLLQEHNRKSRNSRKSLKPTHKELNQTKPSPITLMKKDNFQEDHDSEETSSDNFISCINGYLNQLDGPKSDYSELDKIKKKINKEKSINHNLQKNIIEFQRILLERTEKIDKIEKMIKKIENKENQRDYVNEMHLRKRIAKQISNNNTQLSSQTSSEGSRGFSKSRILPEYCYEKSKRRRTEVPAELERMISRTLEIKQNKKGSSRFF